MLSSTEQMMWTSVKGHTLPHRHKKKMADFKQYQIITLGFGKKLMGPSGCVKSELKQ